MGQINLCLPTEIHYYYINISDTQIGARKNKNIWNYLFMIYGIQNEVKQTKNKSVDITFYDIEKMFDSQWTTDTLNDIYEVCDVKDDKVSLMCESNKEAFVAINTPFGKTDRKRYTDIEMQGSVLGPIKAAVHMDKIGQYSTNKNECSVAATGPPIFEGPRENPKSLSSSKAEKFEFLFLHSVLLGGGGGSPPPGFMGGIQGEVHAKIPRLYQAPKLRKHN